MESRFDFFGFLTILAYLVVLSACPPNTDGCQEGHLGENCDECFEGYHKEGDVCVIDTECETNTCNNHGTCDHSSGAPVCTCEDEYAGDHCENCAEGYKDNGDGACITTDPCKDDTVCVAQYRECVNKLGSAECGDCLAGYHEEANTCVEDTECETNTCNNHGTCDHSSGEPVCTCEDEYAGDNCENCAEGYSDYGDGACKPTDPCQDDTVCIAEHRDCVDNVGSAECGECIAGYHEEANACEEDTQCEANTCNNHGTCDHSSGAPVCTCEGEYAGDHCENCDVGYTDYGDGDCRPEDPCTPNPCTEDYKTQCSNDQGNFVCECDDGYVENSRQECVRYEYTCSDEDICGADAWKRECQGGDCGDWSIHEQCDNKKVCWKNQEGSGCSDCTLGCLDGKCQGCEIGSGPCCDENGQIKPKTEICDQGTDYQCSGSACGDDVERQSWTKYCDEKTHECAGERVSEDWVLDTDCELGALCQEQPSSKPICTQCNHICYEGVCKDCVPGSGSCCDTQGYFKVAGSECGDQSDTECTKPNTCDGAGACLTNHEPAGSPCDDQGIVCLEDDTCDGSGKCTNNGYSPIGTACGDQTDTDCDKKNTCDGFGVCLNNYEDEGTLCGSDADTVCGNPDSCNGSGTCRPNYETTAYVCRETWEYQCSTEQCGALAQKRLVEQFCSGGSEECDGSISDPPWELVEGCNETTEVCETDETTYARCESCDEYYVCREGSCVGEAGSWISISGGSFMMGSDSGESNEQPVHQVTVPTFEMTETEVTVAQYEACVDAGACSDPNTDTYCNWNVSGREDHPINCVDWNQAVAFCQWAGGRLPSEAEWEYAARSGGQDITYPWGNESPTCDYCVMDDSNAGGWGCGQTRTWAVCSKTAGNTDQGLCDMAGNVYEWVQDWWHFSYHGAPADGSAWEDPAGSLSYRVRRGGSWYEGNASLSRASYRNGSTPGVGSYALGFRCARLP